MSQDVVLPGFGFTGYRSFSGSQIERIGPLSKVHLLAGPNNAGKSNVLAVAQRALPALAQSRWPEVRQEDAPLGTDPADFPLRVALAVPPEAADREAIKRAFPAMARTLGDTLSTLLDASGLIDEQGMAWFEYSAIVGGTGQVNSIGPNPRQTTALVQAAESLPQASTSALGELSSVMAGARGSRPGANAASILVALFAGLRLPSLIPPVATVSAFRRIAPGASDPLQDGYDGVGLIQRLAELQSPSGFHATEDERRFAAITRFVATLFDDAGARIQAANDGSTVFLIQNGRRLPLENYGTGVHEVVILAAAATVLSGHLVCIEEPEIHLHPTLQRRLLTYLKEETDNQYLIATHSAHLLDTARASISAVSMTDGRSHIAAAITPRDVADLSAELGLRASDLVQANAIVWVEGPSDRTYLRHWLSMADDVLVEGQHYSIMFYGGALLSELSPEDPSVDEFVSLPRINRNFSILIDSDKHSAHAEINDTKRRVCDAFESEAVRGVVWVTAGYTIENYVPAELLQAAVSEIHPNATYTPTDRQFENPLAGDRFTGRTAGADKAAIARAVVKRWTTDTSWPLDLEDRVQALAEALRAVNDLQPVPQGFKS